MWLWWQNVNCDLMIWKEKRNCDYVILIDEKREKNKRKRQNYYLGWFNKYADWFYWGRLTEKQRVIVSLINSCFNRPFQWHKSYLLMGLQPGTCNRFVGARPGSAPPGGQSRTSIQWFLNLWARVLHRQSEELWESRASVAERGLHELRVSDWCSRWETARGRS